MGERTDIAWTQATSNPWHGCRKISPGCKFCYMFREKRQYGQEPTDVVRSKTKFNEPLKWLEPRLVFTCSWSDWFIEEADDWREDAYAVIAATRHVYQILTKRILRANENTVPRTMADDPRIWWGVSVEDRRHGVPRIDELRRRILSRNLFLSIEPLLEDVSVLDLSGIGWVIVGGESGPERRTMDVAWLASIAGQCVRQNIPLFVKQDSAFKSGQQGRIPDELMIRQFPDRMTAVMT